MVWYIDVVINPIKAFQRYKAHQKLLEVSKAFGEIAPNSMTKLTAFAEVSSAFYQAGLKGVDIEEIYRARALTTVSDREKIWTSKALNGHTHPLLQSFYCGGATREKMDRPLRDVQLKRKSPSYVRHPN